MPFDVQEESGHRQALLYTMRIALKRGRSGEVLAAFKALGDPDRLRMDIRAEALILAARALLASGHRARARRFIDLALASPFASPRLNWHLAIASLELEAAGADQPQSDR